MRKMRKQYFFHPVNQSTQLLFKLFLTHWVIYSMIRTVGKFDCVSSNRIMSKKESICLRHPVLNLFLFALLLLLQCTKARQFHIFQEHGFHQPMRKCDRERWAFSVAFFFATPNRWWETKIKKNVKLMPWMESTICQLSSFLLIRQWNSQGNNLKAQQKQ